MAALDISGEEHVMRCLEKIRASDLDEALLILPFAKVLVMFKCAELWIQSVILSLVVA